MFIEEFLLVNDRKNRQDHESKTTNKMFWVCAADEHNRGRDKILNSRKVLDFNNKNVDGDNIKNVDVDKLGKVLTVDSDEEKEEEARIVIDISNEEDDAYNMFYSMVNNNDEDYIKELAASKEIDLIKVMQFDAAVFKKKKQIFSKFGNLWWTT
jgi:hypothetical protein